MKKILTILLVLCNLLAFAQGGAMADLKFEEAETAFSNNDYKTTLTKLDEFDKMFGSVTAKSLYLRIVSQDKLFDASKLYQDETQFTMLSSLQKNSSSYLKAMESEGLDDKFREIYSINERLKQYPKDKATWQEEKQRLEVEKIAKEEADKKQVEEENRIDIENGKKIAEYDIYPELIKTNMAFGDINTNKKGNLKENERISSYNYLRHNYSFSGMNPKIGSPEISEVLLTTENKVVGYCFLYIDANRNKRKKTECDAVYNSIIKKIDSEIDIQGKEFTEKISYTDGSAIHTKFYYYSSKNSNNSILVSYIFREFPYYEDKYNTARIEIFKLPKSFDKLTTKKIRYLSTSPGYNGYNQIYELLK